MMLLLSRLYCRASTEAVCGDMQWRGRGGGGKCDEMVVLVYDCCVFVTAVFLSENEFCVGVFFAALNRVCK